MNRYFNRFLILAGCAAVLTACDENSWNDKLDGFEVPDKNAETKTISYTMTSVDYVQLAKLKTAINLAGTDKAAALAAVGADGCFNAEISPEDFLPLFLEQPTFQYFALNDGSAVNVTYATTGEYPAIVKGAMNAQKYTVTEADYQSVWESDVDYTQAFAPSKPAARNIPSILKGAYPDAAAGDYVIVNYNQAQTDPVFNAAPEEPGYNMSSVLGELTNGEAIEIIGYVSAVSTQGPIVTDAAGSVFVYQPSNNSDLKVGDQVTINSTVGGYNSGFQITKGSTVEVTGTQEVTYPAAKAMTVAEMEARAKVGRNDYQAPIFAKFEGKVSINEKGYINVAVDGTDVQLSVYGASANLKKKFTDGANASFTGYVVSTSLNGGVTFLNVVVSSVGSDNISSLAMSRAAAGSRAVTVASTSENAMYSFNGSAWTAVNNMTVLNHADYQSMGQSHDNLSGTTPAEVLPIYLARTYPYAVADDVRYVVYYYYNGSETVTRCAECRFTGTEWTGGFNGTTLVTAQYVKKNGKWMYSPDVTITLPAGRGVEISTLYYQTCVDWVKNNVPDGPKYVSSYGNNEYYCGTSAYQGNVDLRGNKAIEQYPDGYKGKTEEEVVALEKKRFEEEVLPAALAILHPDAAPTAAGVEPLYIINFYYYTGSATLPATVIYRVTAPATFTYESCTWNEK